MRRIFTINALHRWLFGAGIGLTGALPGLAAEPVRYVVPSSSMMPYAEFGADRLIGGIHFDLAAALGKLLRREIVTIILPRKRIASAVVAGEIDLRCNVAPEWLDDPASYRWSAPLTDVPDVIFGQLETANPQRLELIPRGSTVGTVLGYSYPALAAEFAAGTLQREDSNDVGKLLQKVAVGRTRYGVVNLQSLEWFARNHPEARLSLWRLKISDSKMHCAVPKNSPVGADTLLAALEQLKKNGQIERILARYR